ncbi:Centromere protein Mis12 [Phaffia rhodozyma]|uniref:Centromere protein Mis12 n=1 Tax=Phaffia rhodozyma TaxID=264483 RepID=A0A0F7SUG0_PHARH|nr:Centromere protein Mis12 [Phaffia rhodozyma]
MSTETSGKLPVTSITPEYEPQISDSPLPPLTEAQQLEVVTELMGYPPRRVLWEIHETANAEIFSLLDSIETYLQSRDVAPDPLPATFNAPPTTKPSSRRPAPPPLPYPTPDRLEQELDGGLHSMETLLTTHMDAAMEKLQSWCYRNAFTVGEFGGVVIPAHEGLDFLRGKYISELPEGEKTLQARLAALRTQVEQKRKMKALLVKAQAKSARSLARAESLKKDLQFISDLAAKYALNPLPETLSRLMTSLQTLQNHASALPPLPTEPPSAHTLSQSDLVIQHPSDLTRAGYLSRVALRALPADVDTKSRREDEGTGKLREMERSLNAIGGLEGSRDQAEVDMEE